MIFLDDEMDSFMYFAYIVAGLAACGYFGAKHHDKSQLAIYVISTAVCTLFVGLTTVRPRIVITRNAAPPSHGRPPLPLTLLPLTRFFVADALVR
jgi:hypothetical protein